MFFQQIVFHFSSCLFFPVHQLLPTLQSNVLTSAICTSNNFSRNVRILFVCLLLQQNCVGVKDPGVTGYEFCLPPTPLLLPAPRPLLAAAVEGNIIITNSSKSGEVGHCLVCINSQKYRLVI